MASQVYTELKFADNTIGWIEKGLPKRSTGSGKVGVLVGEKYHSIQSWKSDNPSYKEAVRKLIYLGLDSFLVAPQSSLDINADGIVFTDKSVRTITSLAEHAYRLFIEVARKEINALENQAEAFRRIVSFSSTGMIATWRGLNPPLQVQELTLRTTLRFSDVCEKILVVEPDSDYVGPLTYEEPHHYYSAGSNSTRYITVTVKDEQAAAGASKSVLSGLKAYSRVKGKTGTDRLLRAIIIPESMPELEWLQSEQTVSITSFRMMVKSELSKSRKRKRHR